MASVGQDAAIARERDRKVYKGCDEACDGGVSLQAPRKRHEQGHSTFTKGNEMPTSVAYDILVGLHDPDRLLKQRECIAVLAFLAQDLVSKEQTQEADISLK